MLSVALRQKYVLPGGKITDCLYDNERTNSCYFTNVVTEQLYIYYVNARGETIQVNAVLCIVFECIAIFDWIVVKRHFLWDYGFWQ